MSPEVKFCGLTRAEDVQAATELRVAFVGVVLAGGPRHQSPEQAAALMRPVRGAVRRVAVVGDQSLQEIERMVALAAPDVLQLHTPRPTHALEGLRAITAARLWVALNARDGLLPPAYDDALRAADGILLDSMSADGRGGSGEAADWEQLARTIERRGRPALFVLAGGLRPENLTRAVAALAPDVVDVSSGVELRPGVKDHERMAAFCRVASLGAGLVTP